MWYLEGRYAVCRDLFGCLAKGQCLGLCEEICHQQVGMRRQRIQRLAEADEIARDQPGALVDKLIEGVLTISAGLAPDDRAGLVVYGTPFQINVFAVAFHVELL